MTVSVENAEVPEGYQIIGVVPVVCPNGHVFELVLDITKGCYSLSVLWCGRCDVGHRLQFYVNSEARRHEDSVACADQVLLFLLAVEASVYQKDGNPAEFLKECSRKLRMFPPPLPPSPAQNWASS